MSLQHIEGRIVVSVDIEGKSSHTFEDGTKITLERKYDNFNRRYTQPVNAVIISAEKIPAGSEVIIHHNCVDESNQILNYKALSGQEIADSVKYYSIKETEAFVWYDNDSKEWMPIEGFDFALRVFKPYNGAIQGIEPTVIKDILWVTTGEYKDKACVTLKASDYELVYQDKNGREGRVIRFRSKEDTETQRECEVVAIHNEYTKMILEGQLHVGLTKSDAKQLK